MVAGMSLIERLGPSFQAHTSMPGHAYGGQPGYTSFAEYLDPTERGAEARRKRFYLPVIRAMSQRLESIDTATLPPPSLVGRAANRIVRESGRPITPPSLYRARASSFGNMLVNAIIKLEVIEPLLPFAAAYEIMVRNVLDYSESSS
jgi:hypothetical protein